MIGLKDHLSFMNTQNFFNTFSKKSHLFYEGRDMVDSASENGTLKELRKIREILNKSDGAIGYYDQEHSEKMDI